MKKILLLCGFLFSFNTHLVFGLTKENNTKNVLTKSQNLQRNNKQENKTRNQITIEAYNLKNFNGFLRVKLFKKKHSSYFPDGEKEKQYELQGYSKIDKTSKKSLLIFEDVPDGEYAVSAFHDDNNSGKLEKSFFGIPQKDWAVSNNIRHKSRSPKFSECAFTVNKNKRKVIITLNMKL